MGSITSAPPSTPAPQSSTPSSAPPNLNGELLTLSALPAGWSVPTGPAPLGSSTCFQGLSASTRPDASAGATFVGNSDGLPSLSESLAHFPGGGVAALQAFAQALNSCTSLTLTSSGHSISGPVAALAVPQIGDQSYGYKATLTYKIGSTAVVTLGVDVIIARRGDVVLSLIFATVGTPDITEFVGFAGAAMNRVA